MYAWQLAYNHVQDIKTRFEYEKQYKWAATVGVLQVQLGKIFIELSVYHPEAFEAVLKELQIERE